MSGPPEISLPSAKRRAPKPRPRKRFHMCQGGARRPKVKYASQDVAQIAAARMSKHQGIPLRVYQCPACNYWHLTKRDA